MTRNGWPLGWDDVTADAFPKFKEHELEQLCRELLDIEVSERFAGPQNAEVEGPSQPGMGGKDLGVRVKLPPILSAAAYGARYTVRPLTSDTVGRTVYSCKTGKNFRQGALKEARTKSAWAVEALRDGGRFVLVVNRPIDRDAPSPKAKPAGRGIAKEKLLHALVKAYADQTGIAPDVLEGRLEIFDANDLRAFVAGRKPDALRLEFRSRLGLEPIPYLLTLDRWPAAHQQERGRPEFEWDEPRERIKAAIVGAMGPGDAAAIWIVGAPGVGKTRLLLETLLSETRLTNRTVVALSFEDGRRALSDAMLHQRHPDAILVVDDCAPHELDTLLPWMIQHNGHGRGRLVVLTPTSPSAVQSKQNIDLIALNPLEDTAVRALVAREIGAPETSEDVAEIVRSSEGFPWFAVLVAREVGMGAPLPQSASEAADLALCSHRELDFDARRLLRARVLLLAMLTESVDWGQLPDAERDELCKAVGLDRWAQVDEGRQACVARGILRLRLGLTFKYVTPAILEREIARKLLTPPPHGPEPLGRRLRQFARRYLPAFFQRLEKYGLNEKELANLAQPTVRDLQAGNGLDGLGGEGISSAELRFAARHSPGPVAYALRRGVEAAAVADLRAGSRIRRGLVDALGSLAGRRATFEDAEAALFRLALAENEVFADNATSKWSCLFFIELNNTYLTFAEKLPVLHRRCTSGEPDDRLVGLKGLGAALTTRGFTLAAEEVDGPHPVPTVGEAHEGRLHAWELLVECMRDGDERVVSKACDLAILELRGAIRTGHIGHVVELLGEALDRFDIARRRKLLEQVALADAHDRDFIEHAGAMAVWNRFTAAVRPRTYAERLHQAVGQFGPVAELGRTDNELAQEGLSPPDAPVLVELDWLASADAVRSTPFLRELGRADRGRILVEPLFAMARRGSPDLIAPYLRGVQEAGRTEEVEAELTKLTTDPALVEAACLTIWRLGATDERVLWLSSAIRDKHVPDRLLSMLVFGSWEKNAGDTALGTLIDALLDRASVEASAAALSLVVHRIEDSGVGGVRLRALLVRALERVVERELSGMTAHWWELGAIHLARTGDVATALGLSLRVLGHMRGRNAPQEVLAVVCECASRDPHTTWDAVADEIERDADFGDTLLGSGIVSRLDAADVLSWVGGDEGRATRVARLTEMHGGPDLHPIARGLIERFGPEGRAARLLAAGVRATPRAVSSLEQFSRAQVERVRCWRNDPDPKVRAWADALHEDLAHEAEYHGAHEEFDRRRWSIAG